MGRTEALSATGLRREIAWRNLRRGQVHAHEVTYGSLPSVIFQENEGGHGNFLEASYRAIVARPEWAARLRKSYSADKWVPRRWDRSRLAIVTWQEIAGVVPGVVRGFLAEKYGIDRKSTRLNSSHRR